MRMLIYIYMNKKDISKEAMLSFSLKSKRARNCLERIALRELNEKGQNDISSSDINNQLISMYSRYSGDWDRVYIKELETQFS